MTVTHGIEGERTDAPSSRPPRPARGPWRPPLWLVVVLVGAAGLALAVVAGASERLCTGIVAAVTAGVLLSPHGPVPDRPVAWRLFAGAAVVVLLGAVVGPDESAGPVAIAATAFGGLLFLAGTAVLGCRRDEHQTGASLIDSSALGVSAGAILWAVVALRSGHGPAVVLTAVELAFDVAVLAQVRILNASRRNSTTVLRLLSAALVVGVGHDVVDVLARTGLLAVPPGAQTALATAPFVLLIAAAIDPSRAALGPGLAATRAFAVRRVVIVGLAVLVAPTLSLVALRQGDATVLVTLVVLNLGVVVLVLARMFGLVARLRTQAARLAASLDSDLLTGLESDRRFSARLDDVLASGGGSPRFVVSMSLSGLGVLNDTLGRSVGDAVIVAAAAVIRAEAGPVAHVARTGAGEFTVLVGPGTGRGEVDALAQRLRSRLDEPLAVRGLQIPATVVIGMAELGADCADAASLLHRCGLAVAAARDSYTGIVWYGPEIAEGAALTAELMESSVRRSPRASSSCTTSPRSTSSAASSWGSRPSCGGGTRSEGSSRPARSSRRPSGQARCACSPSWCSTRPSPSARPGPPRVVSSRSPSTCQP